MQLVFLQETTLVVWTVSLLGNAALVHESAYKLLQRHIHTYQLLHRPQGHYKSDLSFPSNAHPFLGRPPTFSVMGPLYLSCVSCLHQWLCFPTVANASQCQNFQLLKWAELGRFLNHFISCL